jgi:hypothetical protein
VIKLTIRNPSQIENMFDERLLSRPKSNIHVIVTKFGDKWKNRDDIAITYGISEGFVHNNNSIDSNYNTCRHFHNNQSIDNGNDIPYLELLCVNTIQEAYQMLDGKNPFAISVIEHCSKDEFEQGDGNWLHYQELAKLINSNRGNIWRVSISGCESKTFGDNLVLHTNKILMMDARHKDKPIEGQEYFDGTNDDERYQAKLGIITQWSRIFSQTFPTKYFEKNNPVEWTLSSVANSQK